MVYTTITELLELDKSSMTGNEYLLTTNEDIQSNKLKLSSLTSFIEDSVTPGISETILNEISALLNRLSSIQMITIEKTKIQDNSIILLKECKGDIIYNKAMVYDDLDSEFFTEYSCTISSDKKSVIFDETDNLNNKYAVISYLGWDTN